MEIPEKIRIYVGKTSDTKQKITEAVQSNFNDKFEVDIDNGYGNFDAFVARLHCTQFVYMPCKIYYDILEGKRENGKVVLTLT